MEKKLVEAFQWLHRHPELAMKELKTTEYIREIFWSMECACWRRGSKQG